MSPPRRANGWRSRSCSTTTNGRTARPAAAATWMRSRYCWPVTAVAGKARSAVEQGQRVLADLLWRVGGGVALHLQAIRGDQDLGDVILAGLPAQDCLAFAPSQLFP